MVDVSKLQYYSGTPIDKIVQSNPFSFTVASNAQTPFTTPNTYGFAGFMTLSFSIDNVNFYSQDSTIYYYNSSTLSISTQMQVTGACNASTVFFLASSGYPSAQTVYVNYSVDTVS